MARKRPPNWRASHGSGCGDPSLPLALTRASVTLPTVVAIARSFFSSVLPTQGPSKLEENTLNKRDPSVHSDDQAPADGEPADGKPVDEAPASASSSRNQAAVFRFVGLGTELAGFTLVFAGLGYLLDKIGQNPKPYGTALGAMIGFSLGMVRFIQQARKRDDD